MSDRPHSYHCPLCGVQLSEVCMGMLVCHKCDVCFLGTVEGEWKSLTWLVEV